MGVAKILATQEYTHAYSMWKSTTYDERTWVSLKAHLQETYLDSYEIEKSVGAAGYGSTNNKHCEMDDTFMNFASATEACNAAFAELTTTNLNLSKHLGQQEDQIWALQAELCNLKVVAATQKT